MSILSDVTQALSIATPVRMASLWISVPSGAWDVGRTTVGSQLSHFEVVSWSVGNAEENGQVPK